MREDGVWNAMTTPLRFICVLTLLHFGVALLAVEELESDPRDSLFKIFTVATKPDYRQPWAMQQPGQGTGSGALLDNGLIITNAHVIADATFIQVRRHGQPQRHRVHVVAVDHASDLALLRPEDESILADMVPLSLGELPPTNSEVIALGFPTGGDSLSTTRGVLSRVEHRRYAHSGYWLLAAQIDAAINPGNSGGPVLHEGAVAGIVMQGIGNADNIGYMVPAPVVRRFLSDVEESGQFAGWPSIDLNTQNLESPALRSYLQLPDEATGQRVMRLHPHSVAQGIIQENDVILAIDGLDIADDGTVELRIGERTNWAWAIQRHPMGATIPVDLWRDGEALSVEVTLSKDHEVNQLVPSQRFDIRPDFFVYGGLIFTPLTRDFLSSWGREWWQRAPRNLLGYLDGIPDGEDLREEIVILMRVLPHRVNLGWHGVSNQVVDAVDGEAVQSLAHLVELVEAGDGPHVVFSVGQGGVMVLEREAAVAALAEIANTYRLPADRSAALQE
ncbi:MAG: serine protease [Planctomycetota bacterium]|nr:MAG: serine protease [Planctomycetota bacterium]